MDPGAWRLILPPMMTAYRSVFPPSVSASVPLPLRLYPPAEFLARVNFDVIFPSVLVVVEVPL
jgi:hypothetical protein